MVTQEVPPAPHNPSPPVEPTPQWVGLAGLSGSVRPAVGRATAYIRMMVSLVRKGVPLAAEVHLGRRRAQMGDRLRGRVVELVADRNGNPRGGYSALTAATDKAGSLVDTVISLGVIESAADPESVLGAILDALAVDGQLVFVEPSLRPGLAGRVQRRAGMHHDVVSLVRAAGFTITSLSRSEIDTLAPRYRWFVEGIAQRSSDLRPLDPNYSRATPSRTS